MNATNPTDTGWQNIIPTAGDGERSIAGHLPQAVRVEHRPCINCKSFEDDNRRLLQHIRSKKLEVRPDGVVYTPIKADFPGQKIGMEIQIADFGWCKRDCIVTDKMQTCDKFSPIHRQAAVLAGMAKP
jgi:hypothetical protein